MFELGLRLAFDKPTIIKDDETSYSFDTSAIEHLEYPRDLRFSKIVEFKKLLASKIRATYTKSVSNTNYTTFLKHFGEFTVAKIDKKEVSGQKYIIEELRNLKRSINMLPRGRDYKHNYNNETINDNSDINICLKNQTDKDSLNEKFNILVEHHAIYRQEISELDTDHFHLKAKIKDGYPKDIVREEIETLLGHPTRRIQKNNKVYEKELTKHRSQ